MEANCYCIIAFGKWSRNKNIGTNFGISQGSISHFTDRFLEALLDLKCNRIVWPRGLRLATVIQGFEREEIEPENRRLPNVISAMDGTHIPIHLPSKNGFRFVNRKGYHSIN